MLFLSSRERGLCEIRFVLVQKYVDQEKSTIGARWNADYPLENLSPEDHENVVD